MEITLNNTPFSDKQLSAYFSKRKIPRKLKKQIKNYHLSTGKFKGKGILIYDETSSLNLDGIKQLYNTIRKVQ